MNTGLTVADLIADPTLDTHVISGGDGLDRVVMWAHSCEMDDPARWLGPHELLMTIGHCIPRSASAQREFVARLDEAGVAAIAIGEHGLAPRLTTSMLREAEDRGFPLLTTTPDVPFTTIARTVAAAAADERTMAVLTLAKLYRAAVGRSAESRRNGRDLADIVGTRLTVIDEETGCVLIGDGVVSDGRTVRDDSPGHRLRTHRPTRLIVGHDNHLDAFTLMHLTQVLTIDVNAVLQDVSIRLRDGELALEHALTGSTQGRTELARVLGEDVPIFRVVVAGDHHPGRVPLALALSCDVTTVVSSGDTTIAVIAEGSVASVQAMLTRLDAPAGCSAAHRDLVDLTGAVAEARSEYRMCAPAGEGWREFRGEQVSLLSRSRSEAEQICTAVLGPLRADDPKSESLRETLFAFLDHDQQWSETARILGIHRQSLVYRLERVRQLTGRDVRRTQDLAEFWLARTAWEQVHTAT